MRALSGLPILSLTLCLASPWCAGAQDASAPVPLAKGLGSLVVTLSEAAEKAHQVGVAEFAVPDGEPGRPTGSAGMYVAGWIERLLTRNSRRGDAVARGAELRAALAGAGVTARDLSGQGIRRLAGRLGDVDALIVGTVAREPDDAALAVTARLVRLVDGREVSHASCRVVVSPELRTLFGESVVFVASKGVQVINATSPEQQQGGSPAGSAQVLDAKGRPLPLYRDGKGDLYVSAKPQQGYLVRLSNRDTKRRVGVALLVDGLNTIYGHPGLPSDGPLWILPPGQSYDVKGWHLRTDPNGDETEIRQFLFAGAADSEVGRQNFTGAQGMITVVFFPEDESGKGTDLVTTQGKRIDTTRLTEVPFRLGQGISTTMRYVGEATVAGLTPVERAPK